MPGHNKRSNGEVQRSKCLLMVVSFVSILFIGCGIENKTTWNKSRTVMNVVGLLDDSLALIVSGRFYEVDDPTNIGLGPGDMDEGYSHFGIHVVNYRVKKDPLWMDSVDTRIYSTSLLDDQTLAFTKEESLNSTFRIWSLYTGKPKVYSYNWIPRSGCERVSAPSAVRPWLGGKIALLPNSLSELNDSCGLVVVDTATLSVSEISLKSELKWLRTCKDVKAFGDHIFCLALPPSGACGADIFVDGVQTDSLRMDSCKSPTGDLGWRGRFFSVKDFMGSSWNLYYFRIDQRDGAIRRDYDPVTVNNNRWSFLSDSGQLEVIYQGGEL